MPEQLKHTFYQDRVRHTVKQTPYSNYTNGQTYPEQDLRVVGKYKYLTINDHMICDNIDKPDEEWYLNPGPVDKVEYNIYKERFFILRCDLTKPYKMIAISLNGKHVVVADSKTYTKYPLISAGQIVNYCCIAVKDHYMKEKNEVDAVAISCNSTEPTESVFIEFDPEGIYYRVVLDSEVWAVLNDDYDYQKEKKTILQIIEQRKNIISTINKNYVLWGSKEYYDLKTSINLISPAASNILTMNMKKGERGLMVDPTKYNLVDKEELPKYFDSHEVQVENNAEEIADNKEDIAANSSCIANYDTDNWGEF